MVGDGSSGRGGGRIKRHSLIAALLLLLVAVVLPVDDVNATEINSVNQTDNITSNVTQNTTQNVTQNATVKTTSTKTSTTGVVSYTYYVNVPYTVKAYVSYNKAYKVKIRTKVKKWYKYRGKWRYKYVYSYKYVTKYKKAYKWVYQTKYKKVAKTGYVNLSDYVKETKNCQVSNPTIQSLANNLTKNTNTTYDKALKIFNWVRDNLDYSFYYNTKYGAVKTLETRTANCCDHTNLLIALARAEGIPARYMHGSCTFNSGNVYGHVWAQFYINGKWYDADATSFSNTLGSIKNWNTATFTLKGTYAELPF